MISRWCFPLPSTSKCEWKMPCGSRSWSSSHRCPAWLIESHSISTSPLRSYPTTPAPTAIVGCTQSIHLWLPHDGNMLTALFVATVEEITCSADTTQQLKALWKAHNPLPDILKALQNCYSMSYCTGHLPFKDNCEQVNRFAMTILRRKAVTQCVMLLLVVCVESVFSLERA